MNPCAIVDIYEDGVDVSLYKRVLAAVAKITRATHVAIFGLYVTEIASAGAKIEV